MIHLFIDLFASFLITRHKNSINNQMPKMTVSSASNRAIEIKVYLKEICDHSGKKKIPFRTFSPTPET